MSYKQGQVVKNRIREYFYYVNHNGFLFLDDSRMKNFTASYKDTQFLNFFYSRIKNNQSGRYEDSFPYVSLCGIERNYIRCDDTPIVYTELDKNEEKLKVGQSTIFHDFEPSSLSMDPSGRVYHKSQSIGTRSLISDKLTDQLYHRFEFDKNQNPVKFQYRGVFVELLK